MPFLAVPVLGDGLLPEEADGSTTEEGA